MKVWVTAAGLLCFVGAVVALQLERGDENDRGSDKLGEVRERVQAHSGEQALVVGGAKPDLRQLTWVTMVSAEGEALEEGAVEFMCGSGARSESAIGEDGKFVAPECEGELRGVLVHPQWAAAWTWVARQRPWSVVAGERERSEGVVRDERGAPIAGARVIALDGEEKRKIGVTSTDVDGLFGLVDARPGGKVRVDAVEMEMAVVEIGEDAPIEVVLRRAGF